MGTKITILHISDLHRITSANVNCLELLQTKVYQLGKALYNRMGKVRFDKFVASLPAIEKEILAGKRKLN